MGHQKAGLKSKAQSVSCYSCYKNTLDAPMQAVHTVHTFRFQGVRAAFSHFKHFHEHSHVNVTNIVAHSINKTKSCSHKLSYGDESGVLNN